jgi:hypothetical protein
LHSAISVAKRLAKLPPAPTPQFDRDVRAFFAATQPIAVMIAGLKAKVIKGRKPNPDVVAKKAAVAASRVGRDGECQICQHRQILDSRGKLVLHGYERPGRGYIVGDCFGVGHPPWEVACDRLAEWIEQLKRSAAAEAQAAIDVAKLKKITVNQGSDRNPKMVELVEGGPNLEYVYGAPGESFTKARAARVSAHQMQARMLKETAASEMRRLKTWKPVSASEVRDSIRRI